MKTIELYKPKGYSEKYGRIVSIDASGRQETKNPLHIGILFDGKQTTLGELIQKLENECEKLRQALVENQKAYEIAISELKSMLDEENGKQKEINKLLLNAIKEEGVI